MVTVMSKQTSNPTGMVDFSHWPVVVARMPTFYEGRTEHWLEAFEEALAREEPFTVVADMEEYVTDPYESPEEKKVAALWMKRNRDRFQRLCRGNVYALRDDAARAAMVAGGRKQARASGLPIEAAATIPEAITLARTLLD